jgi:hypothetical protein
MRQFPSGSPDRFVAINANLSMIEAVVALMYENLALAVGQADAIRFMDGFSEGLLERIAKGAQVGAIPPGAPDPLAVQTEALRQAREFLQRARTHVARTVSG